MKEQWTEVATMVRDTSYLIGDLFENHEYEFRVCAVNENGQGPPLVGDHPIVARLPFDPPSAPGKPVVGFLPIFSRRLMNEFYSHINVVLINKMFERVCINFIFIDRTFFIRNIFEIPWHGVISGYTLSNTGSTRKFCIGDGNECRLLKLKLDSTTVGWWRRHSGVFDREKRSWQ